MIRPFCYRMPRSIAEVPALAAPISLNGAGECRPGSGADPTTLLAKLALMGYPTIEESARAIIAERLASGLTRRPSPSEFAYQILSRDIEKYVGHRQTSKWVFFDRGLVDAP